MTTGRINQVAVFSSAGSDIPDSGTERIDPARHTNIHRWVEPTTPQVPATEWPYLRIRQAAPHADAISSRPGPEYLSRQTMGSVGIR